MPNNNILVFDENSLNMETDVDYSGNTQRLNGVQAGIASAKLQNKFQRQVSIAAYALAQIMDANGYDAEDTDKTTFANNLSSSIRQTKNLAKLKPGVEYLTDEVVTASDDSIKNIYIKRIEIPDASTFTAINTTMWSLVVPHGITNIDEIIEIRNMFVLDDTAYLLNVSDNSPFYASFENSSISNNYRQVILAESNIYFNQYATNLTPSDTTPSYLVSGFVIVKYTKSV